MKIKARNMDNTEGYGRIYKRETKGVALIAVGVVLGVGFLCAVGLWLHYRHR